MGTIHILWEFTIMEFFSQKPGYPMILWNISRANCQYYFWNTGGHTREGWLLWSLPDAHLINPLWKVNIILKIRFLLIFWWWWKREQFCTDLRFKAPPYVAGRRGRGWHILGIERLIGTGQLWSTFGWFDYFPDEIDSYDQPNMMTNGWLIWLFQLWHGLDWWPGPTDKANEVWIEDDGYHVNDLDNVMSDVDCG